MMSCETRNSFDQPDHSSLTSDFIAARSLHDTWRLGTSATGAAGDAVATASADMTDAWPDATGV